MIRNIIKYIPTLCACTSVFILSVINIGVLPRVDTPNSDKYVHTLMYFFIVICFLIDSSSFFSKQLTSKIYWYSLILSITFGISMELIQAILPWRSFSFYDIIANTIGAGLGFLSYIFINKIILK